MLLALTDFHLTLLAVAMIIAGATLAFVVQAKLQARRDQIVSGIGWAFVVGGMILLALRTGQPSGKSLRDLLMKDVTEDVRSVLKEAKKDFLEELRKEGAVVQPGRYKKVAQTLHGVIDAKERDASLFQKSYLGDPAHSELDQVTEYCREARDRVAQKLQEMLDGPKPLEASDFDALLAEARALAKKFQIDDPED